MLHLISSHLMPLISLHIFHVSATLVKLSEASPQRADLRWTRGLLVQVDTLGISPGIELQMLNKILQTRRRQEI